MHLDAAARRRLGRTAPPVDPLSLFGSDMSAFESLARTDYFRSLQLVKSFNDRALQRVEDFKLAGDHLAGQLTERDKVRFEDGRLIVSPPEAALGKPCDDLQQPKMNYCDA